MKKMIPILLIMAMTIQLAACTDQTPSGSSSVTQSGKTSSVSSASNYVTEGEVKFEVYPVEAFDTSKLIAAIPNSSTTSVKLYVATNGSASGDGSIGNPFATLEQARDKAKALIDSAPKGITIYIRGGVYERTTPFSLTADTSGKSGAPIIYEAYNNENVVLSGGKTIDKTAFHKVTDAAVLGRIIDAASKTKLLEVDLAALKISNLGELSNRGYSFNNNGNKVPQVELFINDNRMTLAKWPNGSEKIVYDSVMSQGTLLKSGSQNGIGSQLGFKAPIERFSLWKDKSDIWASGVQSRDWTWMYNKVKEFGSDNKSITLSTGEAGGDVNTWCQNRGFVFENILEEIDIPGEYYIDRATKKLYLYPPAGFDAATTTVKLSTLDTDMISIDKAQNIVFRNFTMELGRAGAIITKDSWSNNKNNSANIVVDKVNIRNFGTDGIFFNGKNNIILNSSIVGMGSSGVYLNGGDLNKLEPANNLVQNCYIADIGAIQLVYKSAVTIGGVGQIVRSNTIKDTPHMAMGIRGNDHRIDYNEFYNCMKQFRDMGIIYVNTGGSPEQRGVKIVNNYFHHYNPAIEEEKGKTGNWGVYLDNGTQGYTVVNNVFANSKAGGIMYHGGGWNTAQNNIFVNVAMPCRYNNMYLADWAYGAGIVKANANSWKTTRDRMFTYNKDTKTYDIKANFKVFEKYEDFTSFMNFTNSIVNAMSGANTSKISPNYKKSLQLVQRKNVFKNNLIYTKEQEVISNGFMPEFNGGIKDGVEASNNKLVKSDPGFASLTAGDYTLNIDGFKQVEFSKMGSDASKIKVFKNPAKIDAFNTLSPSNGAKGISLTGTPARIVGTLKNAGVSLVWESRFGADDYTIEIAKDSAFKNELKTYTTNKNSICIQDLSPNTTYYWRVTAKNLSRGSGEKLSNANGVQSFTTGA